MLKNSFYSTVLYLFSFFYAFLIMASGNVLAMDQYPYFDPQKGYQIKNDGRPWFDGKDYPFFQEMYDGKGLKPQEEGSYITHPEKSVPVRLVLG